MCVEYAFLQRLLDHINMFIYQANNHLTSFHIEFLKTQTMQTNSKLLVIFTLFAVLWLENKAHHCRFPHDKTHKKFREGIIKADFKCNTGIVPSCQCGDGLDNLYPVPKSGNCKDVFNKHLSKTPTDYHFREENCQKVQRTVCRVDSTCEDGYFIPDDQIGTPPQTPDEFLIGQNTSDPFCMCGGGDNEHYPMPKSGHCSDLDQRSTCYKANTLCRDTCFCNNQYVDPIECDPQKCNNATKPFCMCGINGEGNYFPMPKSRNCMDVIKHFKTTPSYYYRFGFPCYTARNVCKCTTFPATHCECKDECVSGCESK